MENFIFGHIRVIRHFKFQTYYFDENDPWLGVLISAIFFIQETYHVTMKKSPGQLIFGRNMILPIIHISYWNKYRK